LMVVAMIGSFFQPARAYRNAACPGSLWPGSDEGQCSAAIRR
jgi:hypothetical protein